MSMAEMQRVYGKLKRALLPALVRVIGADR